MTHATKSVNERLNERFGECAFRLSLRGWIFVVVCAVIFCWAVTPLWRRIESYEADPDYRVPYALSRDYWLYQRHLEDSLDAADDFGESTCYVVGDSVVWGEYVRSDGTLSHFLAERVPECRFVNAGVNGLFPLALEGLVGNYAASVRNQNILLHCNLLWMSSSDADLSGPKEQVFNHASLVPQFRPRLSCYRAGLNERLGICLRRRFAVFSWVAHLQQCYFGQQDIPAWTLTSAVESENGEKSVVYPNTHRLPFSQVTLRVPEEPEKDPERGPESERHRPWIARGLSQQSFEWVEVSESLQWAAFQRLATMLRDRRNRVLVVVGPFNDHLVRSENLVELERWRQAVVSWCEFSGLSVVHPGSLPNEMYGDASHPLTEGYEELARRLSPDVSKLVFGDR